MGGNVPTRSHRITRAPTCSSEPPCAGSRDSLATEVAAARHIRVVHDGEGGDDTCRCGRTEEV